jgi:hypothetical protein
VICFVLAVHNDHKRNEKGKAVIVGFPVTSTSRSLNILITCFSNSWLLLYIYRTWCDLGLEGKKKEKKKWFRE